MNHNNESKSGGLLTKPLRLILLEHNKEYLKYTANFNDGTYKAEMLKKTSELAKNSERYDIFTKKYMRLGYVLVVFTMLHIVTAVTAFFQADFILHFMVLVALLMAWYSLYTKKTPFAYFAPVAALIGVLIDVMLKYYTSIFIFGIAVIVILIALIPSIHALNAEYIYLSKQTGFPHFRLILNEEIEKNKKALNGEIDLYYANLTAPEGKLGDMDDIEMPAEPIEAKTDGRNDYMDCI